MKSPILKNKVKSTSQISEIVKIYKEKGVVTGLVTGCFDIAHSDHVELFHFAKKHVDVLIVGVDRDESIRLSKGRGRPINSLAERMKVLAEFVSVDYIFPFDETFSHDLDNAHLYEDILRKVKPDYLITNPPCDTKMWRKKEELAKKVGIGFIKDNRKKITSTTIIIEKLLKK